MNMCEYFYIDFLADSAWYVLGMDSALGPVASRTVDALKALISQLGHDKPLPSERTLANRLGISRSTLRVALAHLEHSNHLIRRGLTGRYTNLAASTTGHPQPSKDELEARIIFESALIGDLALVLTDDQKRTLKPLLDGHITQLMEMRGKDSDTSETAVSNQIFHTKLCDLHPNVHARQLLLSTADHINNAVTLSVPVEILITQHQLIIQALIWGDRNLATAAVKINLATELDCW